MSSRPSWHPLSLVGAVLLSSGLVFAALSFLLQLNGFLGAMAGCAGAGLALSVVGFVPNGRDKRAVDEAR